MIDRMSLSKKLYTGFGSVILMLVVLSLLVYFHLRNIRHESASYTHFATHDRFMVEKQVDHLKWVRGLEFLFMDNLETVQIQLDPRKCGLGKFIYGEEARTLGATDPAVHRMIEDIKGPHQRLHRSAEEVLDVWKKRHIGLTGLVKDRLDDHRKWALKLGDMVVDRDPDVPIQVDYTRCAFGNFLASPEYAAYSEDFPRFKEIMESARAPHRRLHQSAEKIIEALRGSRFYEAESIYRQETREALQEIDGLFRDAIHAEGEIEAAQAQAREVFGEKVLPALEATQGILFKLGDHIREEGSAAQQSLQAEVSTSSWLLGIVSILTVLVGIVISTYLARSITKPINRVIESLKAGGEQVAAASQQVAQSSQQMAEGASEQASSLEEISASLEEMSSITRQNADNATEASRMAGQAGGAAEQGTESMGRMSDAIVQIKGSADQTARIVKTIDEIAFQTNLLALNAAVEAARAGEAGKGFAVVAEEVRSLAQRSADAAKDTAELIEESLKNSEHGVQVAGEVEGVLRKIVDDVQKVTKFIGEVSAASSEQAEGIDQVNTAITQMDQVTQGNAANAEESASASEQLSAQAKELRGTLGSLIKLVNGGTRPAGPEARESRTRPSKQAWA